MMESTFRRIWGVPTLLGILTILGLLIALFDDGGWDILSSVLLAIPVATCVWFGFIRRAGRARSSR